MDETYEGQRPKYMADHTIGTMPVEDVKYVSPAKILEKAGTILIRDVIFVSLGELAINEKLIKCIEYKTTTTLNDVRMMVYEVHTDGLGIKEFSIPEPDFN